MATRRKGSTSKGGGVHFTDDDQPPGSPTRRDDQSNHSSLIAIPEKDGSYLVKAGFLRSHHCYEIVFTIPNVPTLGRELCSLPSSAPISIPRSLQVNHITSTLEEDSFLNRAQYEAGFSARLLLKDGAVPSIKGHVEESQAATSTSQQTPTTHVSTQYRHMRCQTDPEPTVSVATQFCPRMVSVGTQSPYYTSTRSAGTQLSYGTLKEDVRSKGGVKVTCEYRTHQEGVLQEEITLVTRGKRDSFLRVRLQARVMDPHHGTPMLLEGVRCLGTRKDNQVKHSSNRKRM